MKKKGVRGENKKNLDGGRTNSRGGFFNCETLPIGKGTKKRGVGGTGKKNKMKPNSLQRHKKRKHTMESQTWGGGSTLGQRRGGRRNLEEVLLNCPRGGGKCRVVNTGGGKI